jgi:hypothetical protein
MNGSEMFTSCHPIRRSRRGDRDRRVALKLVLSVGDDAFAAGKTRVDDGHLAVGRTDLDRARLGQAISIDHPDEKAIRPALDGS